MADRLTATEDSRREPDLEESVLDLHEPRTRGGQAVASNSEDLEWLHGFSPVRLGVQQAPLLDGFDPAGLVLLWSGATLLIGIATVTLSRRDILCSSRYARMRPTRSARPDTPPTPHRSEPPLSALWTRLPL